MLKIQTHVGLDTTHQLQDSGKGNEPLAETVTFYFFKGSESGRARKAKPNPNPSAPMMAKKCLKSRKLQEL